MTRAQPNHCVAVVLLVYVAFAFCATAQEPRDVVSQEIDVRLAEIEIVVTNRNGEAVSGLTREDFEVLQDGRSVELTHFRAEAAADSMVTGVVDSSGLNEAVADAELSEGSAGGRCADGRCSEDHSETDRAGRPRLNLIVYIDRGYLELGDLKNLRDELKLFLRQALAPGDRAMLVSAERSLQLHQSLTTLPELVVSQLDDIQERPGGGRFAQQYLSILRDIQRIKSQGTDLDSRDPTLLARGFLGQVQAFAAEVNGELRQTTDQLKQLIQTIAGLPGRKAVLYIGGRVPAVHSQRLFDAWDEAFGRNSSFQIPDGGGGVAGGEDGGGAVDAGALSADNALFDSLAGAGASYTIDAAKAVSEVAELASVHDVIFHTLDASALRGSASVFSISGDAALGARGTVPNPSPTLVPGSISDSLGSLRDLALGTGGRAFSGSRNFRVAFESLDRDLKTYYSLGFQPLESKKGNSRIEVRLRDRRDRSDGGSHGKLRVRHRSRLRLKDRDTEAAERTVSALLLEDADNPLQVEIEAGEPTVVNNSATGKKAAGKKTTGKRAAAKNRFKLPVSVSVPLAQLALVADGRHHTGRLSIFATSGGLGGTGSVMKAVVPVRIANQDLLTSLGRRVAYQLELVLPAGSGRIAVTVRDDFRPMSSTATTSVHDFDKEVLGSDVSGGSAVSGSDAIGKPSDSDSSVE